MTQNIMLRGTTMRLAEDYSNAKEFARFAGAQVTNRGRNRDIPSIVLPDNSSWMDPGDYLTVFGISFKVWEPKGFHWLFGEGHALEEYPDGFAYDFSNPERFGRVVSDISRDELVEAQTLAHELLRSSAFPWAARRRFEDKLKELKLDGLSTDQVLSLHRRSYPQGELDTNEHHLFFQYETQRCLIVTGCSTTHFEAQRYFNLLNFN